MRLSVLFVKAKEHRHFAEISLWFVSPLLKFAPSGNLMRREVAQTPRTLGQVEAGLSWSGWGWYLEACILYSTTEDCLWCFGNCPSQGILTGRPTDQNVSFMIFG